MPLPKFELDVTKKIARGLFQVDFVMPKEYESYEPLLRECVLNMDYYSIKFKIHEDDTLNSTRIMPLDEIFTLINKAVRFDVNLSIHNIEGTVIGRFSYKGVKFTDCDFASEEFRAPFAGSNGFEIDVEDPIESTIVNFEYDKRLYNFIEISK